MSLTKTWDPEQLKAALVADLAREGLRPMKGAAVQITITPGDRPGDLALVSASIAVETMAPTGSSPYEQR